MASSSSQLHHVRIRESHVAEGTYFVSFATVGWIDVFIRPQYTDILIDSLQFCRTHKDLEIFEYVIMPSHVHLIARRKHGLLSDVLRDMKSFTAKELLKAIAGNAQESRREWMMSMFHEHAGRSAQNTELMFWQKTNHPELIYNR